MISLFLIKVALLERAGWGLVDFTTETGHPPYCDCPHRYCRVKLPDLGTESDEAKVTLYRLVDELPDEGKVIYTKHFSSTPGRNFDRVIVLALANGFIKSEEVENYESARPDTHPSQ